MYRLRFASFPLRVGFFSSLENNFLITKETEKKDKKNEGRKEEEEEERTIAVCPKDGKNLLKWITVNIACFMIEPLFPH